uniref:GDP-D-glucose phosphorylase 1 n=1 Tax=Acrobeloides nanus TaxID=290746 RepID=A0A914C8J3_9BILA
MYKLLDGNYNLSLQLNTERGSLRRKPMPFRHIKEPFNHLRWNFTKLQPNEILFYLKCNDIPYTDDPVDTHIIAINASPLEKDHILIIPSISRCLPQVLTDVTTRIATDLMLLVEDEKFHILFNSLLGYASVNHLHLHGVFWPYDSDLINRKFQRLWEEVYFIRRPNWFIDILAFQLKHQHDFEGFIRNFTNCVNFLNALNMAHNIFFTRAPPICSDNNVLNEENIPLIVTAYLIPRKSVAGAKPPLNFNPAALELVGCLTSSTFHFFDTITEHNAVRIVEEDSVLEEKFVDKLLKEIESRLKCEKSWNSGLNDIVDDNIERNMLTSHELEELNDSFQ